MEAVDPESVELDGELVVGGKLVVFGSKFEPSGGHSGDWVGGLGEVLDVDFECDSDR